MVTLARHSRAGGNPDKQKNREAEQQYGFVRFAECCNNLPDSRQRGNDEATQASKE